MLIYTKNNSKCHSSFTVKSRHSHIHLNTHILYLNIYFGYANCSDIFSESVRPVSTSPKSCEYRSETFEPDPSIDGVYGRRRSSYKNSVKREYSTKILNDSRSSR